MSETISTSSPRSGPSSAEAFAGAGDIVRAWRDGLTPDPRLSVSEWADRHRVLAARASAEPGRYRTARTPYMRAIMDALSPADPARRVVFMKAAQVGATEAGNNWIGFVVHQAPGPMLAVQPTVELAKRNSRQRIDPLIDESAALRGLVRPARSRDAGNTMLSKEFAGGILIMTGANSAVGLRSIPARYIFLDEIDAYPASADEEGDPVTLAEVRSLTFAHRRKVLLISTPTVKGFSRIEREYEASDQRRYFVPCPHCGHRQWLEFERLRWEKGKPETARYHCAACETSIAEHHKTAMLAAGEWRATGTAADPSTIGFHLSALYSPVGWLSWEQIARSWEAAQGSDESIRAFKNTILGETWMETGEAPAGNVSTTAVSAGRRARCPRVGCFSPPAPTFKKTASRSTSGPGAGDWKAGWSTIWSSRAGPSAPSPGPNSTACTAEAIGIVAFDVTAPDGTDAEVTAILRDAVLADRPIVWPAGITEEQKKAAIADLETRGILVRKAA